MKKIAIIITLGVLMVSCKNEKKTEGKVEEKTELSNVETAKNEAISGEINWDEMPDLKDIGDFPFVTAPEGLKIFREKEDGLSDGFDFETLFKLLRKQEYLDLIKLNFEFIPDVPNTRIYTECLRLFETLSINEIHKIVLQTLKNRVSYKHLVTNIKQFPDSLKVAILEANLNLEEQKEFLKLLNTKVNNIFLQRGKYVSSIS